MPSDNPPTTTTLATVLRRLGLLRTADDLNDPHCRGHPQTLEHPPSSSNTSSPPSSKTVSDAASNARFTRARLGRFKPLASRIHDLHLESSRQGLART